VSVEAIQERASETVVEMKRLTAQVTTLTMDKRQVTLSVARQLDQVHFSDMTPWGRIRIEGKEDSLIGVDNRTGRLVTALFPDEEEMEAFVPLFGPLPEGKYIEVCRLHERRGPMSHPRVELNIDGVKVQLNHGTHRYRACTHGAAEGCGIEAPADILFALKVKAAAEESRSAKLRREVAEARSLELIVLAGLK
jgi:hypothetical protein